MGEDQPEKHSYKHLYHRRKLRTRAEQKLNIFLWIKEETVVNSINSDVWMDAWTRWISELSMYKWRHQPIMLCEMDIESQVKLNYDLTSAGRPVNCLCLSSPSSFDKGQKIMKTMWQQCDVIFVWVNPDCSLQGHTDYMGDLLTQKLKLLDPPVPSPNPPDYVD